MPRAAARRFTGPGTLRRPRPEARSGCVRTRAMSCPAPISAARARSANSGVPAKARRRQGRSGEFAQLLCELRANALLLERRKMFDENLALQMVHLVLDAHGEQSLRLQGESVAVLVEGSHLDALGPLNELVDTRHRETAFFDIRNAVRVDDLGIQEHH